MAARFNILHGEDEDLAERLDAGAARPIGSRRLLARVLGASAVAGVAAVGLLHLAPGLRTRVTGLGAVQMKAAAPALAPEEAQERFQARKKLGIQQDLSSYVTAHLPSGAKPNEGHSPEEAAGALFDHVVEESSLKDELTEAELAAFRSRFVDEVSAAAKEDEGTRGWSLKYLKIAQAALESQKPVVTEAVVKSVNALNLGFTAKLEDWMLPESKELFRQRLGRMPMTKGQIKKLTKEGRIPAKSREVAPSSGFALPVAWDAREEWPECAEVIGRIHNQGHCGSCWVFGALGPLDSRMCIKSKGAPEHFVGDSAMLSRGFAASCSIPDHDGCQGGWEYLVYDYIENQGGVPSTACSPYFASGPGSEHFEETQVAPECPSACVAGYPRGLAHDLFQPKGVANYKVIVEPTLAEIAYVKRQMLGGGPVSFAFAVIDEFFAYESGVFNLGCGEQPNHAVHTIGWGDGYLLAQNSWSADWGDKGRFKIALCIPYEFTIPGDFAGDKLGPLPLPSSQK